MNLNTPLEFGGIVYDGNIYVSPKGTITFGQGDFTYWDFPQTPSISIGSYDYHAFANDMGWGTGNDLYVRYGSTTNSICVDWKVLPWGQSSGDPIYIRMIAYVNPENYTWTPTFQVSDNAPGGARYGVRYVLGGEVLPLEIQTISEPPLEATVVEPEPTPSPTESPSISPEPDPEPTTEPTPEPLPTETTPVIEPTIEPSPEPVQPTPTPEPAPTPEPVVPPAPVESVEPEPVVSEMPSPEPTPLPSETSEPVAQETTTPTPTPSPTVAPSPTATATPTPSPTPSPSQTSPVPSPSPIPTQTATPKPTPSIEPTPIIPNDIEEAVSELLNVDVVDITPEQGEALKELAYETFETAEPGSPEYELALEALALAAEADDIELPAELAAIPLLGDVAGAALEVFNNVGNIGADMSPQTREKAEKTVIASVIAAQAAIGAVAAATSAATSAASTASSGSSRRTK